MHEYIANSKTVCCPECGTEYKAYRKSKHVRTKRHARALEQDREHKEAVLDPLEALTQRVATLERLPDQQQQRLLLLLGRWR